MPVFLLVEPDEVIIGQYAQCFAVLGQAFLSLPNELGLAAQLAAGPIDLVFLGPSLSHWTVVEICLQLRAGNYAAPPKIILTLTGATADLAQVEPYVDDYIRYPFAQPELKAKLRNSLPQTYAVASGPGRAQLSSLPASDNLTATNDAMLRNKAFLHGIYEGIDLNVFIIEVIGENDFVVRGVNPAPVQHTGLAAKDLIDKNIDELAVQGLLTREAINRLKAHYQLCVTSGQPLEYEEIVVLRGDITSRWLTHLAPVADAQGKVFRIIGSSMDTTERKEVEQHLIESRWLLREQNELLRSILDSPEGIIIFSLDTHYCYKAFTISHQETMKAIWGVDIKVGMNMLDLIKDPEDRRKAHHNFDRALQGEQFAVDEAYGDNNLDRLFWENRYSPMYSQQREIVGLTVFVTDISERKNHERTLSESLNLVNHQNHRLLNFAYIVSHNLRSHTSNITGLIDELEAATSEQEKAELIHYLHQTSQLLNETIQDLNDVVAVQTNKQIKIEKLYLSSYINKALLILNEQILTKKAIIHDNIPPQTALSYNPSYLESIVFNLLSNALKYSHPDRQPEISLNYFLDETGVPVLQISDNGQGIDLEKHGENLFGMYKTFHQHPDARGIGLFITKNQVEAMGGKIKVESTPGKGTIFNIYLT